MSIASPFPRGVSKDSPDRGIEGAIPPGDDEEAHEDNTYGLPEGRPIRVKLKKFFRDQLRTMLGTVPDIGAPLPAVFPPLADYDDPMASAMTPILSAYWEEAGKVTRARIGIDPESWQVVDPHTRESISRAALAFCRETNATTDKELGAALDELRVELSQGIVETGESIPQLRKRVQRVFARAKKERAELIGRTEAARAVHAASLQSAKESGVVAGKRILLSSNACPLCHEVAAQVPEGGVPLDDNFAVVGTNPTYHNIRMPPIHPNCRCSVEFVLVD